SSRRAFTAAVGPDLYQSVADLNASRGYARATFSVITSYPHGDRRSALRSRVLRAIVPVPVAEQDELPT
ncbi:MAG: hypothetical protein REI45_10195, partial [Propionicimonas sp.]|nr:hypothetical protein [Propionicimonas sp.]